MLHLHHHQQDNFKTIHTELLCTAGCSRCSAGTLYLDTVLGIPITTGESFSEEREKDGTCCDGVMCDMSPEAFCANAVHWDFTLRGHWCSKGGLRGCCWRSPLSSCCRIGPAPRLLGCSSTRTSERGMRGISIPVLVEAWESLSAAGLIQWAEGETVSAGLFAWLVSLPAGLPSLAASASASASTGAGGGGGVCASGIARLADTVSTRSWVLGVRLKSPGVGVERVCCRSAASRGVSSEPAT